MRHPASYRRFSLVLLALVTLVALVAFLSLAQPPVASPSLQADSGKAANTQLADPPRKVGGAIILGFADADLAQYVANAKEPISILSPLSFFVTSASGTLTGRVSSSIVTVAHAHQVVVWPMVEAGFDPSRTNALLTNRSARARLVQEILADVRRYRLDGINLDFEDMLPADAPRFTNFVTDLASALHASGKGLSVDVTPPSPDPNWGMVYQRAALAQAADYVALMTYDEHYAGDPLAGSVASLPWTDASLLATLRSGVPASRLLLGVPLYTRDWYWTKAGLQSSYIPMAEGIADAQRPDAHTAWDAHDRQDILTYERAGVHHKVWLENSTSLRERGQLARAVGLAGVAVWQLDLGNAQDIQSILSGLG